MGKMKAIFTEIYEDINFDELDASEIQHLINTNVITRKQVVDYYNNPNWDDFAEL
ncbi:MAG: hypothetical protein HWN81_00465 [Candidatus Lokiarchaeota archaeon]|nr:hypothetical protein [Candidatus Lokiarchaeota archaeon]